MCPDPDLHWLDAAAFHDQPRPSGEAGPVTRARDLPHVCYRPAHANPAADGWQQGQGENPCIWVACEQGLAAEGRLHSNLDGVIDSRLPPGASIGWHRHTDSEEIYYLLEGSLMVSVQDAGGQLASFRLQPGDRHLLSPGMAHAALAGDEGARFIAVLARVPA